MTQEEKIELINLRADVNILKAHIRHQKTMIDILVEKTDMIFNEHDVQKEREKVENRPLNVAVNKSVAVLNRHDEELQQLRSDIDKIIEGNRLLNEFIDKQIRPQIPLSIAKS